MKHSRLAISISLLLTSQMVIANPNGAQVVQGTAAFSNPSANVLNINNSRNAIINWQSFNIGAGQTTNFIQPSSTSAVLNRVISANPSQIMGNLNSNGRVFLINQHGILVGEGAHINTSGFFGSTLNITNEDFLNGKLKFNGGGQGDLENQGYIHAGEDGSIVLIAPNIENGGVVEVENGNIILAAGKSITITSLENSSIQFEVTSAENQITNLGQVIAKNGAASLFAGTLKHSGSIRASGLVQNADGSISLVATDRVEVSGSVDVTGDKGGYIEILADVVEISDGASIDASGVQAGGEILLGGDRQGLNPDITNATTTSIAKTAQVHADATDTGNGGKVIIFAEDDVHVHGEVTAKGGVNGGDGGFIETSGLKHLDITSVPDASAPQGANGEWLIDPNNIDIVAVGANDPADYSTAFTSPTDSTTLSVALINAALDASTNVTIITGAGGTEDGDINVNADISTTASTPGDLTLTAHNDININADIDASVFGMNITLQADSDSSGAGSINFTSGFFASGFGDVNLDAVDINITGDTIFGASNDFGFSSQLTIDLGITLTLQGNAFGGGVNFFGSDIIIDGTLIAEGICSDGCTPHLLSMSNQIINNGTLTINNAVVDIAGSFVNNGIIDIPLGESNLPGILVGNSGVGSLLFNPGSSITGVTDSALTIGSAGTVDFQQLITMSPGMTLVLDRGTILNAQNLTIPNTFYIYGGTLSGPGVMDVNILSDGVIDIDQTDAPLTINNLDINFGGADVSWIASGSTSNITLNNSTLIIGDRFEIDNTDSLPQINGTGGAIILQADSFLTQLSLSPIETIIDVPVTTRGYIEVVNAGAGLNFTSGDLTLSDGARLTGNGTITVGNVFVESGGGIDPGGDSGFSTLTIDGNVTFEADSLGIFEVYYDGEVTYNDVLDVTGSVTINAGSNLYMLWGGYSNNANTGSVGRTFDIITTTTGLSGSFDNIIDPLTITASTNTIITGLDYRYGITGADAGATVFYWDGQAGTVNWDDAVNWNSNVLPDVLPGNGDYVIIDGVDVTLNSITANLAGMQNSAILDITTIGELIVSGDLINHSDLNLAGNARISGAGSWHNLSYASIDSLAANISIASINNYSALDWVALTTGAAIFNITSDFTNRGNFKFYLPLTSSNNLDLIGGLNNYGLIRDFGTTADLQMNGTFVNHSGAEILVDQGNVMVNANSTLDGTISISNTSLLTLNGGTYNILDGLTLNGDIAFNNASVNIASTLVLPDDLTLSGVNTLSGTLEVDGNLSWASGVLQNSGTALLNTTDNANITLGAAGSTSINGVDWINDGFIDWVSADDFIINNATYTSLGGGTFNVATTSNNADISGNGLFDLQAGRFEINSATSTDLNIGVIFDTATGFDIGQAGYNLIFENDSSYQGVITVDATSQVTIRSGVHTFDPQSSGLIFDSDLVIEGGTLTGTLLSNASIDINAALSDVIFDSFGLTTTGTSSFTSNGNDLELNNSSIWTNDGILNIVNTSNTADFTHNGVGSNGLVNNIGATINVSTITDMDFSTNFDNQGNVNITGTAIFATHNTTTSSGTIDIAAGAEYRIEDGVSSSLTLAGSPAITGSGSMVMGNNTVLDVAVPVVMDPLLTLILNGTSMIDNAQNLTVPFAFEWHGGTIRGLAGENITLSAGTSTLLGGGSIVLDSVNLVNEGDMIWSGTGGTLAINNGAEWRNLNQMTFQNSSLVNIITNSPIDSGMTNLNSATLLIDSASEVSIFAPFANFTTGVAGSGATIDIQSGTLSMGSALVLDEGSSLLGGGILNASLIVDDASVNPGNDLGSLQVNGDVTFNTDSELVVQLENGGSDLLNATGNVTINPGASLSVVAFNGYDGVYQESFSVIQSTGLTGAFGTLNQETDFTVSDTYGVNDLNLTVSSLLNIWTGSVGDGLWSSVGNWSHGAPGAGHETFIDDGVSTVVHDAGDDTILSLTMNTGTQLDVTGGSISLEEISSIGGVLNLSNSSLSTLADLSVATLSLTNAVLSGNNNSLSVANPLTLSGVSTIENWSVLSVPQFTVNGTATLSGIGNITHDGQITVATVTDQLILLNSTMTSSSLASIGDGAGILDLQTGSDWVINAVPLAMPEAMTLNLNGGNISNVENLTFPGTVNAHQVQFTENNSLIIPLTTTFNYFTSDPVSPTFDVINNGTFNVLNVAGASLSAQNGAVFINNGTLDIAAGASFQLLTELQNNGIILGDGILSINGGSLDLGVSTVLPASLAVNLFSGDIVNANNLRIDGDFNWQSGTISGDGVNSGFETTGQVTLVNGTLNTDWLISAGTVDWTGFEFDNLIINNSSITNQGVFRITSLDSGSEITGTDLALKDFSLSSNAGFINQGSLLVDAGLDTITFDLDFDNVGGSISIISGRFSLAGVDLELDQSDETLQGFGVFIGNVINTAGVVTPGRLDPSNVNSETGSLIINGDYTQGSEGTLLIKLDATTQGLQHDMLNVAGTLTADGGIDFQVVNGSSILQIASLLNQSFSPLSFTNFAGRFAESTIPEGLSFTLGEGGVITVTSDAPLLNEVANQLEVLLSQDNLDFTEIARSMKFTDQKLEVVLSTSADDEEDDDKRAPRLVCK